MSTKEINRMGLLEQVVAKQITQAEAATSLNLSDRQLRRILAKYRVNPASIAHGSRGQPSKRQLDPELISKALELIRTKYPDFGPTFASEKLQQLDGIEINHESLRQAMITAGLWQPKQRKARHRMRRERRPYYGDMEQFDGCRHDWFEGRNGAPWATLLASRDDANNTVRAKFVAYEGTVPVMSYWLDYFVAYGKPRSIYLDRHSTYKVNTKSALDDDAMISQFERAMKDLNVQVIHANSPQAKGRIENLFGTLQDRLVKELRLADISTISEANEFLATVFLPDYNQRFCVVSAGSANVHQQLQPSEDLPACLSIQTKRLINQDFTIRFKNKWLQLAKVQPTLVLPKQTVTIEERLDSSRHIKLNGHYLNFQQVDAKPAAPIKPITALASSLNAQSRKPPPQSHPWRKFVIKPKPKKQNRTLLLCRKPDISTLR